MTTPALTHHEAPGFTDSYAILLAVGLAGYAVLGKGFAYLGIPPLFVGEALFIAGIFAVLRTRMSVALLANPASVALIALMAWVTFRTIPYVSGYGVYALRDSVIAMYGGFAFIVAALILEDPRRLSTALGFFPRLGRNNCVRSTSALRSICDRRCR